MSYGVSLSRILEKIDHVLTVLYCGEKNYLRHLNTV